MKIINKTGKVVGIGSLTLMPDGSGELPVSFGNNPIIADMVRNGELAFDTEDVKVQADAEAAKAAKRQEEALAAAVKAAEEAQKKDAAPAAESAATTVNVVNIAPSAVPAKKGKKAAATED